MPDARTPATTARRAAVGVVLALAMRATADHTVLHPGPAPPPFPLRCFNDGPGPLNYTDANGTLVIATCGICNYTVANGRLEVDPPFGWENTTSCDGDRDNDGISEEDEKCLAVYADHLNITDVQRNAFHLSPSLQRIWLQGNQIKFIDRDLFKYSKDLLWLDLSGNGLRFLERGSFRGAPRLQILDLNDNDLFEVTRDTFDGAHYIESLRINNNRIQELPQNLLHGFLALKELRLAGGYFERIERFLLNTVFMKDLVTLDFSNGTISHVDPKVFAPGRLPRLKYLSFMNNYLSNLTDHDGMWHLPSLEVLFLNGNEIVVLPNDMFLHVQRLDELDLSNNNITYLEPVSLEKMYNRSQVARIDLSNNKLRCSVPLPTCTRGCLQTNCCELRRPGTSPYEDLWDPASYDDLPHPPPPDPLPSVVLTRPERPAPIAPPPALAPPKDDGLDAGAAAGIGIAAVVLAAAVAGALWYRRKAPPKELALLGLPSPSASPLKLAGSPADVESPAAPAPLLLPLHPESPASIAAASPSLSPAKVHPAA